MGWTTGLDGGNSEPDQIPLSQFKTSNIIDGLRLEVNLASPTVRSPSIAERTLRCLVPSPPLSSTEQGGGAWHRVSGAPFDSFVAAHRVMLQTKAVMNFAEKLIVRTARFDFCFVRIRNPVEESGPVGGRRSLPMPRFSSQGHSSCH